MTQKMIYFSFMFGVWLVYVGSMFPIFLLFMSLGQSLRIAMIVASIVTFLFIIVQRTFRGLHLINRAQDDTADFDKSLQLAEYDFKKSVKQVNKQNRKNAKVYRKELKRYQHQLKAYQKK